MFGGELQYDAAPTAFLSYPTTIAASTSKLFTWVNKVRNVLVQNLSAGSVYLALDQDTATGTSYLEIIVPYNQSLLIRNLVAGKLAVYCDQACTVNGTARNLTVLGWSKPA
jgi:hypothetical protein